MSKVRKMKVVDGKPVLVEIHEREEMLKIMNEIFDEMESMENRVKALRQELEHPTDKKLADMKSELDSMKAEVSRIRLHSLYILSEEDREKAHQFWLEHKEHCPTKGRCMAYVVWGTGIGDCIEYGCRTCGEVVDLTDTSRW